MAMNAYWRSRFAWSNSRHNQWAECKKQYYFNYIKKWDGLPNDPGRDLLWRLSELQKTSFLKGRIIHDAIKQQIANHNAGRGVSADAARAFFLRELEGAVSNMHIVIAEAANGFPPDAGALEELRKDGLKQVENFCNIVWPNYEGVNYLSHEKTEKFFLGDIPVWVKHDLFAEKNGVHVITDWKSGSEGYDDINDNIQLGIYLLWAHKVKGIPLERLKGEVVYLRSCNSEIAEKDQAAIDKVAEFVKKDAAEMLSVSSEADFPASPSAKKCMGCNFLALCEEGKETVALLRR